MIKRINYNIISRLMIVFFAVALSGLNAADTFTVEWLRKGCEAVVAGKNEPNNLTKDQDSAGAEMVVYLHAFITGANSMCLANEAEEQNSKLTMPPENWIDGSKLAPMLLDFLRENPNVKGSAKARQLMMAFYYINHPDSTKRHKALGKIILEKTYK